MAAVYTLKEIEKLQQWAATSGGLRSLEELTKDRQCMCRQIYQR